jgi:hypothetical protein
MGLRIDSAKLLRAELLDDREQISRNQVGLFAILDLLPESAFVVLKFRIYFSTL